MSSCLTISLAILPSRRAPNLSRNDFISGPIWSCAARDRFFDRRAQVVLADAGRQIALDDFEFGLILVDEILAIALAREHQRFFAARLLALEDLYDRSFVGLAADVFFDFEAGNFGEHAAQHHGAGLVAGFHRGRKFIAQFLLHNYLASSPQLTRVRRMAKGILSAQRRIEGRYAPEGSL